MPLRSSTVVCSNVVQCHSLSSCCFPHLVTPARRRSSSVQFIHLLFGRPLDLFPVGYNWCTLLVSLLSFIRNTCPSHFNRISSFWTLVRVICLIVSFVILSLYVIRIILLSQRFSQPILHVFGESP